MWDFNDLMEIFGLKGYWFRYIILQGFAKHHKLNSV